MHIFKKIIENETNVPYSAKEKSKVECFYFILNS